MEKNRNRSLNLLFLRFTCLFTIGILLTCFLYLFQVQKHDELLFLPYNNSLRILSRQALWVLISCGTISAMIGMLYPYMDNTINSNIEMKPEWTAVTRCIAVFVGINHASATLDFVDHVHFSVTLASFSLALWWLFDGSSTGFGLGLGTAALAACVGQILLYAGILRYPQDIESYFRSWVPCIFFSGGVTMGNIGKQLALYTGQEEYLKLHTD